MIEIQWHPDRKTLRLFGLISLVAFPLLGLMAYYRVMAFAPLPESSAGTVAAALGIVGVLSGILAVAAPIALKPLFLGLSLIGAPIGFVVSHLVLTIIYYLVITPIALVFKLIGRDALHRKLDPAADSYWIPRAEPRDVKRYFKQF